LPFFEELKGFDDACPVQEEVEMVRFEDKKVLRGSTDFLTVYNWFLMITFEEIKTTTVGTGSCG
jgi:hypothetical protein